MYDRILVPLDGSASAGAALALAELIPSEHVMLLQVEPDTTGPMLASAPELAVWREAREAAARAFLTQAGETLARQGRTIEIAFDFGDPATKVIAAAKDADLIVMTTHGRGAGGRAIFGGVADRVARHAQTATLVVRGGERPADSAQVARIVVPLDGSPLAEQAVATARSLADDVGVAIHLLRVVDDESFRATVRSGVWPLAPEEGSKEDDRRQAEEYLAEHAHELRRLDLVVTTELLFGPPAVALLDAVRAGDLIVMTTHGRSGLRRWLLGSVVEKLIREAPAPVLVVRGASTA